MKSKLSSFLTFDKDIISSLCNNNLKSLVGKKVRFKSVRTSIPIVATIEAFHVDLHIFQNVHGVHFEPKLILYTKGGWCDDSGYEVKEDSFIEILD